MIILNEQQEKIKNEAVHWFRHESSQVFEISGAAGTGKTVLIKAILEALHLRSHQYYAMAYTGQASIVMRTRGFKTARSIHSTLYEVVEIEDKDENLVKKFGMGIKKKDFRLRSVIDPVELFFIDEAYMVPDWMVSDILSFGIKVIVAGDANQLPPVGANPAFLTGYGVHYLTQLMRQAEGDPIVYLANRVLDNQPIHCGRYGNNVLVINDDDFIPEMVGWADCICCGTNKTREAMNNYVRTLAGLSGNIPHFGERVICRKNNWEEEKDGIALANGLAGVIVKEPNPQSFNGKTFIIDFKPDLADIIFDDIKVSYDYFIATFEEKNQYRSYKTDNRWIQGEYFDFSYALTTHLCQGSEYNNVVYFEEFLKQQIQQQLNYTAITRAREGLIYIKKSIKYY